MESDKIYPKLYNLVSSIQSTIIGLSEYENIQYKMHNWNSIYLYQMQHNGKLPQIPCTQYVSYLFMNKPHPMYYDFSGGTEANILGLLKKLKGLRLLHLERKHKVIPNPNIEKLRNSGECLGGLRTIHKPYRPSQLSSMSYSGYEDGNDGNATPATTPTTAGIASSSTTTTTTTGRNVNKVENDYTTSRNSYTSYEYSSMYTSKYKHSNISRTKLSVPSRRMKNNQVVPTNEELSRIPSANSLAYCHSSTTMDDS